MTQPALNRPFHDRLRGRLEVSLHPRLQGEERVHVFESEDVAAGDMAGLTGRAPLLRGETGAGESQVAGAVAKVLGRRSVGRTLDARTEPRDLFYSIDYVRRLSDAQTSGAGVGDHRERVADLHNYVVPGPFWWGIHERTAAGCRLGTLGSENQTVPEGAGWVVLIDEIDKADIDVPHALLEVLGNHQFPDAEGKIVSLDLGSPAPLVVVTTNEDKELPGPFVRRCVVHEIQVPDAERSEERFLDYLVRRGRVNYPTLPSATLREAAKQLRSDRLASESSSGGIPGVAEYLDLLRALDQVSRSRGHAAAADPDVVPDWQSEFLTLARPFIFGKHRPRDLGADPS